MATVSQVPLTYIQGDTLPAIACVYQTVDPTSGATATVDITGYTFMLAYIKNSVQITKTATLDNPTQGKFSFHFGPGDLDTPGTYQARITMVTPSMDTQSWQTLSLAVQARVGV